MSEVASKTFNWSPKIVKGDDPRVFVPDYTVKTEAALITKFFKSKFADLPSAGIWENRTESDEELLKELGSGWRGFATGQ